MLKHHIFNLYKQYVWLLSRYGNSVTVSSTHSDCEMMVITIAYNHTRLIEKQIELVKRYVKDEKLQHVVFDNSPDKKVRSRIKAVCKREHIEYVPVPIYIDWLICHRIFGNGLSHGAALNWMFYHYLTKRRPAFFALLDHDVFPLRECCLKEKLDHRDFYGVERSMRTGWYLWPGWCIFRFETMERCKPDFLPYFNGDTYLDAGGGNYHRLYCYYSLNEMDFPDVVTKRIKKTEGLKAHADIYHSDCIQYIDYSWLHIINGSNCAHIPGKEKLVDEVIDHIDIFQEYLKKI